MADSWLTDGDCSLCRRNKYCSKDCKRHKELCEKQLCNLVLSRTELGFALSLLRGFNRFS